MGTASTAEMYSVSLAGHSAAPAERRAARPGAALYRRRREPSIARRGWAAPEELLDLRFPFDRFDLAVDLRGVFDVEAAAHVGGVAAEDAAVDDLCAALNG